MFSNVFFLKKFFCCLSHLFTLFLSLISFYVKRCLLGASMFVRALMLGAPTYYLLLHTTICAQFSSFLFSIYSHLGFKH
ncbi:unnamed protein product [Meloidogyne enterolobii]|uniref:Uncharacterized protein n=1 Tax=Meloidogyne enterolobii TaxID=390850 RepID=A0ACB1A3T8_MELEN